jgi:hypothetical protein
MYNELMVIVKVHKKGRINLSYLKNLYGFNLLCMHGPGNGTGTGRDGRSCTELEVGAGNYWKKVKLLAH